MLAQLTVRTASPTVAVMNVQGRRSCGGSKDKCKKQNWISEGLEFQLGQKEAAIPQCSRLQTAAIDLCEESCTTCDDEDLEKLLRVDAAKAMLSIYWSSFFSFLSVETPNTD